MATFAIDTIFNAVDNITAPVRKISKGITRLTRRTAEGIRAVTATADNMQSALLGVGKTAAIGLGGTTVAVGTGITLFNQATTELDQLSKAVNSNAGTVGALAGALKGAGFETDNVIDLFEELNNKIGESAGLEEIAPVTESLAILGLEFENIRKLAPEQQFNAITNAALGMEDAQKAAAAADILLGGEANKIIGVLRQQGGTVEDIIGRYRQFNFMTERATAGAGKWTRATQDSTVIAASLGAQISGLAGEQFAPLVEVLNETLVSQKANINSGITEFFARVAESIEFLIKNFSTVIVWFKRIAKGLAVFVVLTTVLKTVVLVMTAVNLVMSANPIALLVIAVAGLVAIGIELAGGWEEVGRLFVELWPAISGSFKGFFDNTLSVINWLLDIPNKIRGAWNDSNSFIGAVMRGIVASFSALFSGVSGIVRWFIGLPGMIVSAWTITVTTIVDIVAGIGAAFKVLFLIAFRVVKLLLGLPGMIISGFVSLAGVFIKIFVNPFIDAFRIIESGSTRVIDWLLTVPERIKGAWDGLGDFIGGILGITDGEADRVTAKAQEAANIISATGNQEGETEQRRRESPQFLESRESMQVEIGVRPEPGAAATMKQRGTAPNVKLNMLASGGL